MSFFKKFKDAFSAAKSVPGGLNHLTVLNKSRSNLIQSRNAFAEHINKGDWKNKEWLEELKQLAKQVLDSAEQLQNVPSPIFGEESRDQNSEIAKNIDRKEKESSAHFINASNYLIEALESSGEVFREKHQAFVHEYKLGQDIWASIQEEVEKSKKR